MSDSHPQGRDLRPHRARRLLASPSCVPARTRCAALRRCDWMPASRATPTSRPDLDIPRLRSPRLLSCCTRCCRGNRTAQILRAGWGRSPELRGRRPPPPGRRPPPSGRSPRAQVAAIVIRVSSRASTPGRYSGAPATGMARASTGPPTRSADGCRTTHPGSEPRPQHGRGRSRRQVSRRGRDPQRSGL